MSMGFDKFLVNFAEVIFGITTAEAIIIIFLFILYTKKKNEITKLTEQLSKMTENAKKWHDESVKNLFKKTMNRMRHQKLPEIIMPIFQEVGRHYCQKKGESKCSKKRMMMVL